MAEVGSRIRELRKARNWTQRELAERAGLSEISIKTLEADKYSPRGDTLDKLARAFDVPISTLLGEDDPLAGPAPVAKWQAWGLDEALIRRYARLWPGANKTDRQWLDGQLQIFAQANAKIRSMEAQADAQDRTAAEPETDPPVPNEEPDPIRQYAGSQA